MRTQLHPAIRLVYQVTVTLDSTFLLKMASSSDAPAYPPPFYLHQDSLATLAYPPGVIGNSRVRYFAKEHPGNDRPYAFHLYIIPAGAGRKKPKALAVTLHRGEWYGVETENGTGRTILGAHHPEIAQYNIPDPDHTTPILDLGEPSRPASPVTPSPQSSRASSPEPPTDPTTSQAIRHSPIAPQRPLTPTQPHYYKPIDMATQGGSSARTQVVQQQPAPAAAPAQPAPD